MIGTIYLKYDSDKSVKSKPFYFLDADARFTATAGRPKGISESFTLKGALSHLQFLRDLGILVENRTDISLFDK